MIDSILCSVRCWTLAGPEISRQIQRAVQGNSGMSPQEEQEAFRRSCASALHLLHSQQDLSGGAFDRTYQDIKDCEARGCGKNLADESLAANGYEALDYMCDGRNIDKWSQNMPCIRQVSHAAGKGGWEGKGGGWGGGGEPGGGRVLSPVRPGAGPDGLLQRRPGHGRLRQRRHPVLLRVRHPPSPPHHLPPCYQNGGLCSFTKCSVECENRAVSAQCGQEAANLIDGFIARSINGVQVNGTLPPSLDTNERSVAEGDGCGD